MTKLTVEIRDEAVRQALDALQRRIGNMQPALAALGEDMTRRAKQRFDTQTGPDGQAWKPLKPATVRAKGSARILFDKGELRRQIVPSATATSLTLTSTPQYAAIHQFGGTIDRKAGQVSVSHRTNAKGELLRSAIMNGKGLVFAKASHKRKLTRTFDSAAHQITIAARPFMPVRADGTLYPAEQREILAAIEAWIAGGAQA